MSKKQEYEAIPINAKSDQEFAEKIKGLEVVGIIRVEDYGYGIETVYSVLVKI